jgi:hypothetical protein
MGCARCDPFAGYTGYKRFDHWKKARHTGLGIGFSDGISTREAYGNIPFKYVVATTLT